ncbi:hypothetical protein CsatA_005982 [Cannabis sativa]
MELLKPVLEKEMHPNKSPSLDGTMVASVVLDTNVRSPSHVSLCHTLQMVEANKHSIYLGFPKTLCRNKTTILGFLKDKIRKRIQHWDGKLLSRVGEEILIKMFVKALANFSVSIFLLSLDVTKDSERSITKFWWHTNSCQGKGVHWIR